MQAGAFALGEPDVAARRPAPGPSPTRLAAWALAMVATGADAIEAWAGSLRPASLRRPRPAPLARHRAVGRLGGRDRPGVRRARRPAGALVGRGTGAAANRAALVPAPVGGPGRAGGASGTRHHGRCPTRRLPRAGSGGRRAARRPAGCPRSRRGSTSTSCDPRPAEHQRAHRVDGRRHRLVLGERLRARPASSRSGRRRSTRRPAAAGAGRRPPGRSRRCSPRGPMNAKIHDSEKPKSSSTTSAEEQLGDVGLQPEAHREAHAEHQRDHEHVAARGRRSCARRARAERAIGSERRRSMRPPPRSSARPTAVWTAPKATTWAKIAGHEVVDVVDARDVDRAAEHVAEHQDEQQRLDGGEHQELRHPPDRQQVAPGHGEDVARAEADARPARSPRWGTGCGVRWCSCHDLPLAAARRPPRRPRRSRARPAGR